jgi:putative nucleotidyltransferase with HDIG domain
MNETYSVDEILKAVATLPGLPNAVVGVMRTLEDENTTFDMLTRIIESDVGLVAGVLRLVNSSHYAVSGGVSSVHQAVVILGFDTIRGLACTEGISNFFRKNAARDFNIAKFMRHSVGVACCARVLARQVNMNPEAAFVSGLLHDVGQLAMAVTFPEGYRKVQAYKASHDCYLVIAEQAIFGVDHAFIGAHLVDFWHFPKEIGEAIRNHHQIFEAGSDLPMVDLIHVAEVLSHALDLGVINAAQDMDSVNQVPPLSDGALFHLGLTFGQMESLFEEIEDEYSDMVQMLDV